MHKLLDSEITFLPGVGPKKAQLLTEELGIKTFNDLLFYFPFRYIDRSRFYNISDLHKDLPYIQIKGRFTHFELSSIGRGKKKLTGYFSDETGVVEVVWFQSISWIQNSIKKT